MALSGKVKNGNQISSFCYWISEKLGSILICQDLDASMVVSDLENAIPVALLGEE